MSDKHLLWYLHLVKATSVDCFLYAPWLKASLYRASDRLCKKKSNFAGFSETDLQKIGPFCRNFTELFRANFTKNNWSKTANFMGIFWANFARYWSIFHWFDECVHCFLTEILSFAILTTKHSRNEPMTKLLWLVPIYS